jgi:hypothetical protein
MGTEAATLAGSIAGALLGYDPFPLDTKGKPTACFISDHPYAQWWGTNGDDGLAAMFKKRHIKFSIAINTGDVNAPGGSADMMSWEQCAALQSSGVEFLAHGVWHVNDWSKISTGFVITYTGANGTATVQFTSTQGLLVAGGADDVTVTLATDTTLAAVKATIEASGKWTMTLDPILTGAESSALIFTMNAARSVKAGGAATYFCIGGGIRVAYTGRTYTHVWARRNSTAFTIFADGVQKYSLTLGTNSLQTLVDAINAISGGEFVASLCDNGRAPANTKPSYQVGDELATNLLQCTYAEIGARPYVYEAGMPQGDMIDRHLQSCIDTAAAHGVTIKHFAQSGGGFYGWMANRSPVGLSRGNTFRRIAAPPFMQRANIRNFFTHRALTNDATVGTITIGSYDAATTYTLSVEGNVIASSIAAGSATLAATALKNDWNASAHSAADGITASSSSAVITMSDAANIVPAASGGTGTIGFTNPTYQRAHCLALFRALAGADDQKLEPWFYSPLIHKVRQDGSTGLNLPTTVPSYYDQREDDAAAILDLVAGYVRAGSLVCVTASELAAIDRGRRPYNLFFNPTLENAGDEFAPLAGGDDGGFWIPGVGITRASTQSVFKVVDGALVFSNSSATATELLYQDVDLEPGKSYDISANLAVTSYTSGAGLQWSFQALGGRMKGIITPGTNYKITGAQSFQPGRITMRVTVPKFENMVPCEVRGDIAEPYNLSTLKYIKLNINSIGAIDDLDCSAGASSASAVTAKEAAAAINAAIAATAAYGAEYHTAARAIAGRLVITSPTVGTDQGSSLSVSNSTNTNRATAALFGNATVDGRAQLANPPTAENYCFRFALRAAFQGSGSISKFSIRESEFN